MFWWIPAHSKLQRPPLVQAYLGWTSGSLSGRWCSWVRTTIVPYCNVATMNTERNHSSVGCGLANAAGLFMMRAGQNRNGPSWVDVHTSRSRNTLPGRAALISSELDRLAVDEAALSETRLLDKGELERRGYHFLYSGNPLGEKQQHGVAIAIILVQHWHAVNARIVTARINLRKGGSLMVISAYAPTLTNSEESK